MKSKTPHSSFLLRQRAEGKYQHNRSAPLQPLSLQESQQLFHELQVHQIELEMQNEELRLTQESLEASRARYFILYELAPFGYLTITEQGLIRKANLAAAAMLAVERRILPKTPISRWVFRDDQDVYYLHCKKMLESAALVAWDMRLVRHDGSWFWGRLQALPADNGEYWLTVIDITASKLAENKLQDAASYTRSLIEASLDPLFTISIDGKVTDANSATEKATGIPRDKLVGTDFSDYFTEPEKARAGYQQAFKDGFVTDYPLAIRHVSGRVIDVLYNATVYRNEAGNVAGVFAAARDVTERKQVEAALQRSEKLYHTILHTALEGFWITDTRGHLYDVNDAYCRMIGYSRDELLGMNITDIEALEDAAAIELRIQNIVSQGTCLFESKQRCRDGQIIDVAISTNYLPNEDRLFTFLRDITQSKREDNVMKARLRISNYALDHSLDELLIRVLDEAEALTESSIGFLHFVDADQVNLSLQAWSSNTLATICSIEGFSRHYPLEKAGMWADCIRDKRPMVHNSYETLPGCKGLPPGHAPLVRFIVVPIFRNNLIVAVLGVGNKAIDYGSNDVATLQHLANLAWDILKRKRVEIELQASENRFRAIMDLTPNIAVQGYTIDGTATYWNNASEIIYGYSREEALGRNMLDLIIPPELHAQARQALIWMAETGKSIPADELLLKRKDNSRVPVYSCHALLQQPGREMELFCMDMDLTTLKQTQESLKTTELKYSRLFESMTDAYVCVDMDGRITESNAAFQMMTGYGPEELASLTYRQLTPENWHEMEEGIIRNQIMVRGYSDPYQKEYRRKDGTNLNVELKTYLLKNNQSAPVGKWAIIRDITERKLIEMELRQAKETAEEANNAKSDFLATVSHEIRTPLGAMLGNLELLEGSSLTTSQQELLTDCKTASQMLLQVLNDVLDYSKIEAGKFDLASEAFSVTAMGRQLVRMFKAIAQKKGLNLNVCLAENLPAFICSDKQRLLQILSNLLNNAIKFTRKGAVSLEIACDQLPATAVSGSVILRIVVKDTGIGIPADRQEDIFNSFTRVESFKNRTTAGTGLGLPICRRLLSLMGGSITVASVPGEGSTFTVVVPVAVAWSQKLMKTEAPAQTPAQTQTQTQTLKILLADDDLRGKTVAQKLLQRRGYIVTAVGNGTELLDVLQQEAFDIILTDISMPDMDGTRVAQIIRSGERIGIDSRIPIIAMTAHAFDKDRERFLAAGINGYVSKPVNLEELYRLIEELCSRDVADRASGKELNVS